MVTILKITCHLSHAGNRTLITYFYLRGILVKEDLMKTSSTTDLNINLQVSLLNCVVVVTQLSAAAEHKMHLKYSRNITTGVFCLPTKIMMIFCCFFFFFLPGRNGSRTETQAPAPAVHLHLPQCATANTAHRCG